MLGGIFLIIVEEVVGRLSGLAGRGSNQSG